MSAPAGPRLSWTAFAAVMAPFLLMLGFFMRVLLWPAT